MTTRTVADLEKEIDELISDGYRLDMIMPADSPREALMSRSGEPIRLVTTNNPKSQIPNPKSRGRAGMEYRDLIPDRLDGLVIASHIRLTEGGEVSDYVHYHKIDFQMIYCKSGWIRVVYEDQGEPFVLAAGDCVLQPPEIRHRVLESSAGAEVIEVSSPAEHETWIDHEMDLPTNVTSLLRTFDGQMFVRHMAHKAVVEDRDAGFEIRDLGLLFGTGGLIDAKVKRTAGGGSLKLPDNCPTFVFVLDGSVNIVKTQKTVAANESLLIPAHESIVFELSPGSELLQVSMPGLATRLS